MKRKITLITASALLYAGSYFSQTSCSDLNGFVNSKNVGATGSYQLKAGFEEYAAQTYHYSGPGKVSGARIYGNYPGTLGGAPLKISVYNVDASGRPTTLIQSVNSIFWAFDNAAGYTNINFPGSGVTVSADFAIAVQLLNAYPFGNAFNVQYTGNGEGHGQDLASLSGTSTGFNWASAKNSFGRDGDFYLVPRMTHFITAGFTVPSVCVATSAPLTFGNTTAMTKDSMFNKISLAAYNGTNKLYTWNFGDGSPVSNAVNPSHAYTTPGVYTVTLTATVEGWGATCSNSFTKKISVGLAVNATSVTNVACNGSNNGSVSVAGTGGSTPYTYNLLPPYGTYSSGSTFNGLGAGSYTVSVRDNLGCLNNAVVNITQPASITFGLPSTTNATCGNSDGAILIAATGGAGSLQYKLNNGTYQSSGSFSALSAGNYSVTVKDANGCTKTTNVIVNDLGGPALSNVNSTNVSCNGGNDGSISLSSTGGTGSILYSVNGGATYQSSGLFNNLPAGPYTVVVKDNALCTDISTVTINQPQTLSLAASSSPATCNGLNNGEINVTSTIGGTGIHNFSINGINYQSGTNFSGLSAGTYTVYVKDVTGCVGTTTAAVSQPAALISSVSSLPAGCNGSSDGILTTSTTGGSGSYLYSIDGVNYQASGTFDDLAAGTYTITTKDGNNCTFATSAAIGQPAMITATINTTNSTCGNANGGILVSAGGGSGSGYTYSINGSTYNSTGSFSLLSAGTYYIIVRDGSSCEKIVSATIVDSNGPAITNNSSTNVSCNGGNDGSITITTVTGGTGLLQYSINGTTWQTSPVFSGLQAGSYVITVKDANSCSGTIAAVLTQPNAFSISANVSNILCNGSNTGAATILASGGSGILAYDVNGGGFQGSNTFSGLAAGNYTVGVKDAAGCLATSTFTVAQPPAINVVLGILNVNCFGNATGAINASASGGTGALAYSLNGSSYSSTSVFNGLTGNTLYTVFVKDANGCVQTQSAYVSQPSQLNAYSYISNVNCSGGNSGAISVLVSGGTFPYNYQWSNGATTQGIFNLTASVYSVNITDDNGCSISKTYTITQPSNPLVINSTITGASSGTSADGSINITVTGGTAPYTYNWSNGSNAQNISGLNPGAYLISITDANGCEASATYVVGNILGISEFQVSANDVQLYPNPANALATIKAGNLNIDKIEMINLLGESVYSSYPKASAQEINIAGFETGSYFVKIYVGNKMVMKKLIIAR